jgi:hypothetical protein
MNNYIIIHGNVVYKVENVDYISTETHRRFTKEGKIVLSVPLSSVLVMDGKGVTAQIVNGLTTGVGVNPPNINKTVVNSEDNFTEGLLVGGIIGAALF